MDRYLGREIRRKIASNGFAVCPIECRNVEVETDGTSSICASVIIRKSGSYCTGIHRNTMSTQRMQEEERPTLDRQPDQTGTNIY